MNETVMPIKKKWRSLKSAWKSSGAWTGSNCGRDLPNNKVCGCISYDLKEKTGGK